MVIEMEASLVLSVSACLANAIGRWPACCVSLAAGPAPLDFEASGFPGSVELAFCCVSYFLPCRIQEELQLLFPSCTPGESFWRLSSSHFRGLKQLGN